MVLAQKGLALCMRSCNKSSLGQIYARCNNFDFLQTSCNSIQQMLHSATWVTTQHQINNRFCIQMMHRLARALSFRLDFRKIWKLDRICRSICPSLERMASLLDLTFQLWCICFDVLAYHKTLLLCFLAILQCPSSMCVPVMIFCQKLREMTRHFLENMEITAIFTGN